MQREDYIKSFQEQLVEIVADRLTPAALRYGYTETPLEANIKWLPQVLFIGGYSSGKSTLINELLGADIQGTGQAPTDDSFTVITCDESIPDDEYTDMPVKVTEERDGKVLLNDPEYPFESLKKHGERFASHFRLKKVSSPFLKNLAIIDTPGMLDSISERDRGYNYQEIIGKLAQIADLILVLFDPHKAGTVREVHTSLRVTLPARTFEDRILFVLNRIDECSSLTDLLRVYGTLCWNLSQITGRKDIPMIHLTYSQRAAKDSANGLNYDKSYLNNLENEQDKLKKAILQAPRHHLDHLASFIETHTERLSHFSEALISYAGIFRKFRLKNTFMGLCVSILFGGGAYFAGQSFAQMGQYTPIQVGAGTAVVFMVLWCILAGKLFVSPFHRKLLEDIDNLTPLDNQSRQDNWKAIKKSVRTYLEKTSGRYSMGLVKREYKDLRMICEMGCPEIREVLKELSAMKDDESAEFDESIFVQEPFRTKEKGVL
ncbi:MAG: Dynamin family protein [Desulfobacterales bacterium]|nr:Dynamin family protein [Desulfobacterales bacterium]